MNNELETLLKEYEDICQRHLSIDISRGKPSKEQLDLSNELLSSLDGYISKDNIDVRNYGGLTGIKDAKDLFSDILDIKSDNIIIYGNSSLNIMYDYISRSMTHGVNGCTPWCKLEKIKWLCPVPGYDRHFSICEYFNIEMINIPMDEYGPDMDLVEQYIKDPLVKGMWIVPIYSNPTGIIYSDEVINRLARLKPAAKDFRIYCDQAYIVHHLYDEEHHIPNLFQKCLENHNEDIIYVFASTSKMTYAGGGISCSATSDNNIAFIKKQLGIQYLSANKVNQLMHARFLKDKKTVENHMKKHADIIRPKFALLEKKLKEELGDLVTVTSPRGGYFISMFTKGIAKEVVKRCKDMGLTLTDAGCAYPYHKDPENSHIRIAPTLLDINDIDIAVHIIALSVKIEMLLK